MKNILFIGGPMDGQWMAIDKNMPDFRVMKEVELSILLRPGEPPPEVKPCGPRDEVKYTKVHLTHNGQEHIEVMFMDEGTPLLQKLIDGYKAS